MTNVSKEPRVLLIGLGGTIAMEKGAGAGVVPKFNAQMLVDAVPELKAFPGLEAISHKLIPGAHLTFDDLYDLACLIEAKFREGYAGFVVSQGTDTIEETAFALDCLIDLPVPVVVTGAMRGPTQPGAEGPANLLAAVTVASEGSVGAVGTVVVMNDEVHAARFVTKGHSTRVNAFQSPNLGPIGYVKEGRTRLLVHLPELPRLGRTNASPDVRVALLRLSLDDRGELIDAAIAAGFNGIVVEGVGGGHASGPASDRLAEAARTVPVVLAHRCGGGETLTGTYGFKGSEIDLRQRGLITSGLYGGVKARVLLSLLLRERVEPRNFETFFDFPVMPKPLIANQA